MKEYAKSVATQATAILIAAAGAAAIAFLSSVAGEAGLQCTPSTAVQDAGILGGLFKGIHSAFQMSRVTLHV